MLEDRLRPRYSARGSSDKPGLGLYRPAAAAFSAAEARTSPQQKKARAIVKKYRRKVRYAQLTRLRSLVPTLINKEEASEVC